MKRQQQLFEGEGTTVSRAWMMERLRRLDLRPRRDLSASYVAAEESLIARDAARAVAALLAGDEKEHRRVGRIVASRCFGIYPHPHGRVATRAMVGGRGETAEGWRW